VPQGKVKWFSAEKAFGFIEQENDNDIFVHVTGLADGVTAIDKDMLVEYEVEQGRKGPQATNVRPVAAGRDEPAAAADVEPTDVEPTDVEPDEPTDVESDEPTDVEPDEPTDVESDEPTDVEPDEPTDVEPDEPTE
jgi:cold shock protein